MEIDKKRCGCGKPATTVVRRDLLPLDNKAVILEEFRPTKTYSPAVFYVCFNCLSRAVQEAAGKE